MSVCWTPMCEILVSKMFVCAMPYVLVPVVLQWDVIVLDDCVPDVFVMGACRGCLFCMSVCIMYVLRIYILLVCVFDDCVAVVGVRHLCVFNAQIWNVCLQNVCDQYLFREWLCGFNIVFVMGSFVLDASVRDLRLLNGWVQFLSYYRLFYNEMSLSKMTVCQMSLLWVHVGGVCSVCPCV